MGYIIGLGEVLWDILPDGRKLGGAPANFAYHVNALGGKAFPVSRVGYDELGDAALKLLQKRGLDISHITRDARHPTGTVLAELDSAGKASYTFPPDVAWDFLELSSSTIALAGEIEAVCFGSLAQRSVTSRQTIQSFIPALPASALRVFDINLRGEYYTYETIERSLKLANILKVSDEELPKIASIMQLGGSPEMQLLELIGRFDLHMCALTRGEQGSLLISPEAHHDHPGYPVDVADTIGAGDSFTAAMTLGLLSGWSLEDVNERANRVAVAVCAQAGAMPKLPDNLKIL